MKLRDLALALLLVGAALAAYHNSFDGAFLFDDHGSIRGNPNIYSLWPLSRTIATPPDATLARRPLVTLSFALNSIGVPEADHARNYHLGNLSIHILVTLLVYAVARRAIASPRLPERYRTVAPYLAAAIALLWTVHPLLTEAVDYLVQRTELFVGLFLLATIYAIHRGAESPRGARWYGVAVLACALGMASKEVMAVTPCLALLYDRAYLAGSFGGAWSKRRNLYLALGATWVILVAIALFIPVEQVWGFGLGSHAVVRYVLTQSGVILHYLRLAFWPSPLVLDYDGWPIATGVQDAFPEILIMMALFAAAAWATVKRPALGFLGAWFFLLLAPSSSFFPIPSEVAAERRMYLPLIAVVALVVVAWREWIWPALARAARPRGARFASAAILLCVCAGLARVTLARNLDYRDERAMWRDVVAKRPDSPRAHLNLGVAEMRIGQIRPALDRFDEAIALRPNWAVSHFQRASALRGLERNAEALDAMREAVRLNPDWNAARLTLGASLLEAGQHDEAITHLTEVVRRSPGSVAARNNLGFAYLLEGRVEDAVRELRAVVAATPEFPRAHLNLGKALNAQGNTDEALAHFEEAVRLDPSLAEAWISLGQLKAAQGKRDEAIRHFQEAIRANPNSIDSYSNLAMVLIAQERVDEAVQVAAQATAVAPQSAVAHHSLGLILSRAGHEKQSIAELREAVRLAPDWPEALNNLAWALATSPDATLRDGREAVALAEQACTRTEFKLANMLDTLGAAYAEAGRFAEASRTAAMAVERAAAVGQQGLAEQIARRQDAYDAHRPYREPS